LSNLGDTVGYGAKPTRVVAKAQSLDTLFVRGNHDKPAAGSMNLEEFNPVAGFGDALDPRPTHARKSRLAPRLRRAPFRVEELPGIPVRPRLGARRNEYMGPAPAMASSR